MEVRDYGTLQTDAYGPDGIYRTLTGTEREKNRNTKALDILDHWLRQRKREQGRGITKAQYDAGRRFQEDYEDARMRGKPSTMQMERIDGQTAEYLTEKMLRARHRYQRAYQAMGMMTSHAVVAIVCDGEHVGMYAKRMNINPMEAKGIVKSGLDMLTQAYGLTGIR